MSMFLRKSTSKSFRIGPFLNDIDGKTAETGLTITQPDVRLSKIGLNMVQKNDATACIHDELGFYRVYLDATDTEKPGSLLIAIHKSGALPVFQYCTVLVGDVYDTWFSTNNQQVHAVEISDGLITSAAIATDAIGASEIAADAIGASELATNAIGSAQLADSAVTKIFDFVTEGALTFVKMFRVVYAVLAGKSAGGGSPTITFRDVADGKDRVSATVDNSGNRTAITNDGT